MSDGYLDTNVFLHAAAHDEHSEECVRFLTVLANGQIRARLEPMVVHELSYALPRFLKQLTRTDVASYLITILSWPGIEAEKDVLTDTVQRWARTPGLSFVDAYLAAMASSDDRWVFTKNVRELVAQGVIVPQPLPSAGVASG